MENTGAGRGEEGGGGDIGDGGGGATPLSPHPTLHGIGGGGVGDGHEFPMFFLCTRTLRDRPGRRAKGSLHRAATRGLRRGNGLYIILVMI